MWFATHTHIAPIQPPQLQYDAGSSGRSEPLCYPQALSNLEQDRQGFEGGRELVEEGGREERVGKDDGKTVGSEGGEGKDLLHVVISNIPVVYYIVL